jgi:hypothetical protein
VIEIRSYRRVFELERRIYRIDRLRLNPAGVPVLGIVYSLAILGCALLLASLPLVGGTVKALPWYARDLLLPGAGATILALVRIDGRPFHLAARALLRHRMSLRQSGVARRGAASGQRWYPGDLLLLPDGSDAAVRRFLYRGPGAVLVAVEHERTGALTERGSAGLARSGHKPKVVLRARSNARPLARGQVICVRRGARLTVRPERGPRGGRARG